MNEISPSPAADCQQVRQREAYLRSIFRVAPIGIGVVINRILHQVNQRLCTMTGYQEEELLGQNARLLYATEEDYQYVGQEKYAQIESQGSGTVETSWRRKDGQLIEVLLSSTPIDPSDLQQGITFTALDITAQKAAHQALQESEAHHRRYLNHTPYGVFTADRSGCFLQVNPSFCQIAGYQEEQLLQMGLADLHGPDNSDQYQQLLELSRQQGSIDAELAFTNSQGAIRWWALALVHDGGHLLGFCNDITARRTAMAQVELDKETYLGIFNSLTEAIYIQDRHGTFIDINKGAELLYQCRREDLLGQNPATVAAPGRNDLEEIERLSQFVLNNGVPCQFEFWAQRPNGEIFLKEITVNRGRYFGQQVLIANARDISDRKRAEEALRESEAITRAITDSAKDAIVMMDAHGEISFWNPAAEQIFGYSAEEALGQNLHRFLAPPQFQQRHQAAFPRFQQTGQGEAINATLEMQARHKDGHEVPVELSLAALQIKDSWHAAGIMRDISERKRAENEKKQLQTQLAQAQKMEAIGTLAGGIAHDFNNILSAILGYAEMAREDIPPRSLAAHDLSEVMKAGNRAKDLVKQILAFSRQAESAQVPLQPASIIKEAAKLLRSSLPTTIAIRQQIEANCGAILADPTQIHQILMNLCTNAFHAMEFSGGTLTIGLAAVKLSEHELPEHPRLTPGNFVCLSVTDTGSGISESIRARIFDPYFTTKETGKGTGMGLAIVHGIVQSYGGFIRCQSQQGQGSTFSVFLPATQALAIEETPAADSMPLGTERVLLVDDEQILAEMGQAMLQRLGYQVTVCTSSLEALTTFRNQPDAFDLVVTDQTMPGMTGTDLARCLLQIRPHVPIVLCTGYSNLISEEKARAMGILGFAMKPLSKKTIATIVRRAIDESKASS